MVSSLLTEADQRLLPYFLRQNRGFHLASKWYFRGFDPLPYQWVFHQFPTMNTSFVGGIACGKTTIIASSYMADCLSTPYFRALNTSVTARQAELAFDMAMSWIEGNPKLEHLIENIVLRPYPLIKFKNYSEFEFRTSGTDARYIRGSEYDRINFDEAGLDYLGLIIKVLRGRLRGVRPDGTNRLARLDTTTSPTDAEWLQERHKRGDVQNSDAELDKYRSMRATTWMNTRLLPEQIAAMEAEYPPDMIDVELGGEFPDYGTGMFASGNVNQCINQAMYDLVLEAVRPKDDKPLPGYRLEEDPRHGIILFEMPREEGRDYIAAGDPGIDNFPRRNSPVVMVADVTTVPYRLVYFRWISGRGSYNPFLTSYKYVIDKYLPIYKGIDDTGPQKSLSELGFENFGILVDSINFTRDKTACLNALSMDIGNHRWAFAPIKGLISQLKAYNLEMDAKKMAQDIVMAIAQISFLKRYLPEQSDDNKKTKKANYPTRRTRTNRYARRY